MFLVTLRNDDKEQFRLTFYTLYNDYLVLKILLCTDKFPDTCDLNIIKNIILFIIAEVYIYYNSDEETDLNEAIDSMKIKKTKMVKMMKK